MDDQVSRVSGVLMRGPLAPFAQEYKSELESRGYAPRTVVDHLYQVSRLGCWLDGHGLGAADLGEGRISEFLAFQRAAGRHRRHWSRPGLLCLLWVLRRIGVAPAEEPAATPSAEDLLVASFERYLLAERGLAASTVRGYAAHARLFLGGLTPPGALAELTAEDVIAAVLAEAGRVSVSAAQYFITGLRSFLRFCFAEGLVPGDLSPVVLSLAGRRPTMLPRGISQADAAALLGSCDLSTAIGLRDHAILTTLLRLGLRAAEVAALALDDVDWRGGQLTVAGKGGRTDRLPLPADAGEAIAAYLRHGRPASGVRAVFLKALAPYGPVATRTVSSTVRRACARAGIPEVGAHRLRHTTACEMVFAGVPLVQAAQVLRHQSLQTTAIYARANVSQLRGLALPWPAREEGR